jgi:hypothetical protein
MERRRRTITAAITLLVISAFLAACDVPTPFETSASSPGAEAAKVPGVRAAGTGTVIGERTGIAAGSAILWASDAERNRQLDAIAATGARWFTIDIDWNSIQGAGQGTWWWDATDRLVTQARARGLRIIGVIAYTPTWARPADCPAGTDKCLPASPETFADMARAAAQRYGTASTSVGLRGSINVWQIWNEPNHFPFVQPTVDAARYTRMLKRAYVTIKEGDPTATVLAGGTAPAPDDAYGKDMSPMTFLRRIYANGGKGYFDAFAHHPYSFPCSPLQAASWNAFTQTKDLHVIMEQNGDGAKKVWGTEAGAPTASNVGPCGSIGTSVTEAQQAQFVADYFTGWDKDFASFTGPLIWYQIRDNGTDPGNFDDHLGLLRRDWSEKPAYRTFKRLILG